MNEEILQSIKKLLGLPTDYAVFDQDIIIHINSVLMTLRQLGVRITPFSIVPDGQETWGDLLEGAENLEAVKSYVYMKVRLMFDPPSAGFQLSAIENMCRELEWRLNVGAETPIL